MLAGGGGEYFATNRHVIYSGDNGERMDDVGLATHLIA